MNGIRWYFNCCRCFLLLEFRIWPIYPNLFARRLIKQLSQARASTTRIVWASCLRGISKNPEKFLAWRYHVSYLDQCGGGCWNKQQYVWAPLFIIVANSPLSWDKLRHELDDKEEEWTNQYPHHVHGNAAMSVLAGSHQKKNISCTSRKWFRITASDTQKRNNVSRSFFFPEKTEFLNSQGVFRFG